MIEKVVGVRRAFPILYTASPVWAAFLDHWDELTDLYYADSLYATTSRMLELRAAAEKWKLVVPSDAPLHYPMKLVDPAPVDPVDPQKLAIKKVQDWLVPHMEQWHGPRATWSDATRERFHEKFGFLILFATDFRFPETELEEGAVLSAKGVCETMTSKQRRIKYA